ncbi:MAG: recombinase family protein [Christensenellaceae bacterium]|nr:recombinase family protein [Christensenellaceae bacterium]MEA5066270.1 recombinase family protein [Eubacteriales bacterium]MEA5068293.1 recombinase family protein [Christensenellaceae bacterium]
MKTALIYARSACPNSSFQIDQQQSMCKAFAEKNGFIVTDEIAEYGVVGGGTKRPSLQKVLSMAGAQRVDVLILPSLSRISRKPVEALAFLDAVSVCGVEIWSVREGNYAEWRAAYAKMVQQVCLDYLHEREEDKKDLGE